MKTLNNKGQSLVFFVLILPLLIMIACFAIDMGYLTNEKMKLDNINKLALNYYLDNNVSKEELQNLIIKNDDSIMNILIELGDEKCITLNKKVNSLLGNIFGFKSYEVNSSYCIKINDSKREIYKKGK